MDLLARARAFEQSWRRALATTVAPVTVDGRVVGELLLTAPVPRIRDHNAVLLEEAVPLEGDEVVDLLDRELGGRGVGHRRLYAPTPLADAWEGALASHGHERCDVVVLRWAGRRPAPGADVTVVTADAALAEAATRALRGHDLDVDDPAGFLRQLVWLVRAQHEAGARVLVALEGTRPVGHVRVFRRGDLAQVEELDVHPDVRRRGVGRTLLAAALGDLAGLDLVFLTADPDDWTVDWYERLGFVPLGRSSGFVRDGAETPPS